MSFLGKKKFKQKTSDISGALCFAQEIIRLAAEIATGNAYRPTQVKFAHQLLERDPFNANQIVGEGRAVMRVQVGMYLVQTGLGVIANPGHIESGYFYLEAVGDGPWCVYSMPCHSINLNGKSYALEVNDSPYWPKIDLWEIDRGTILRRKATGTCLADRKVYC